MAIVICLILKNCVITLTCECSITRSLLNRKVTASNAEIVTFIASIHSAIMGHDFVAKTETRKPLATADMDLLAQNSQKQKGGHRAIQDFHLVLEIHNLV